MPNISYLSTIMETYILVFTEVIAVIALTLFGGALNSENYEKFSFKALEYLWVPIGLLLVATYLTVMRIGVRPALVELDASTFIAHSLLHLVMVVLVAASAIKFNSIQFMYTEQYLLARSTLYFSIVFEVFAIGVFVACCLGF